MTNYLMNMKNSILVVLLLVTTFSFGQGKKWTLEECVNHAVENNISVKQAELTTLTREQDVIASRGQFLPSLSANASQSINIGSGFDPVSFERINQTTHSTNFGANVSQNVFNGFRTLNLYKQSKLNLESSQLELSRIKDDISLNVVNAYLNVLFNKENLAVAQAQYEFSGKQLEQVQQLVDAGVQPKGNLLDAQATLSNDEQSVTVAENNLELAKLTLSQLLQVPFSGFDVQVADVGQPSETMLYADTNSIYGFAVDNRWEIKVAEKNMENAVLGTEISKAGYYPSVSLNYGFSSIWSESENDFTKTPFFREIDQNKGHNISLRVNIPIFSQFANKTAVAQSRINEETMQYNLEQAKLTLQENIQRAFTDANAALKTYLAAQRSVEAREEAFKNAQERYNIGAMNAFDFEQSRNNLISSQSSLINAKYDFVFKTKVLDFYAGKSLVD